MEVGNAWEQLFFVNVLIQVVVYFHEFQEDEEIVSVADTPTKTTHMLNESSVERSDWLFQLPHRFLHISSNSDYCRQLNREQLLIDQDCAQSTTELGPQCRHSFSV